MSPSVRWKIFGACTTTSVLPANSPQAPTTAFSRLVCNCFARRLPLSETLPMYCNLIWPFMMQHRSQNWTRRVFSLTGRTRRMVQEADGSSTPTGEFQAATLICHESTLLFTGSSVSMSSTLTGWRSLYLWSGSRPRWSTCNWKCFFRATRVSQTISCTGARI